MLPSSPLSLFLSLLISCLTTELKWHKRNFTRKQPSWERGTGHGARGGGRRWQGRSEKCTFMSCRASSRYPGLLLANHTDECTVGMQLVRAYSAYWRPTRTVDWHCLKHSGATLRGENAHIAAQLKHTQWCTVYMAELHQVSSLLFSTSTVHTVFDMWHSVAHIAKQPPRLVMMHPRPPQQVVWVIGSQFVLPSFIVVFSNVNLWNWI